MLIFLCFPLDESNLETEIVLDFLTVPFVTKGVELRGYLMCICRLPLFWRGFGIKAVVRWIDNSDIFLCNSPLFKYAYKLFKNKKNLFCACLV